MIGDGRNASDWEKPVLDYAQYIGIDPQREPQLMWIAQEGLEAPLPAGWAEASSADGVTYYCEWAASSSNQLLSLFYCVVPG
jgi:centrosomal protein CEP164